MVGSFSLLRPHLTPAAFLNRLRVRCGERLGAGSVFETRVVYNWRRNAPFDAETLRPAKFDEDTAMTQIVIGRIVRLQIQRSSLKVGEKPNRVYDPAPLLAVETLGLTLAGAEARLPDGTTLLDVHNARHPETKNIENENMLSVGFTHHYDLIRRRFGEHIPLGSGGENIIVETDRRIEWNEVMGGVVIQRADGTRVPFENVLVAEPCRPFAGYLLGRRVDVDTLKASVQFLHNGLRGYYLRLAQTEPATVAVGDFLMTISH
jgi:hypothetical protein